MLINISDSPTHSTKLFSCKDETIGETGFFLSTLKINFMSNLFESDVIVNE